MKKIEPINKFFESNEFALVGISENQKKFGNLVLKELLKRSMTVYPIHRKMESIDGLACFSSISKLPDTVNSLIVSTNADNVLQLLPEAKDKGIINVWLQQGSENQACIEKAESLGLNCISKECLLMYLEPVGGIHKFHRCIRKLFGSYPK